MNHAELSPAFAALTDAEEALDELHAMCCEPERSPRMAAIGAVLTDVRASLGRMPREGDAAAHAALDSLEDAGAQIGRLQIGCCATGRLPLYALMLERLTVIQLEVNRTLDRGH